MSTYYDEYKHLLGAPYDDGDHDCYGLCRRYYKDVYGLDLPDYARSNTFFKEGIDLITPFLAEEGFDVVDAALDKLEPGDGLLLTVRAPWMTSSVTNHVAVYCGNNMMLHHMLGSVSKDEDFDPRWKRRVTAVLRHPAVTKINLQKVAQSSVDLLTLLPDHVRARYAPSAE